MKSTSTYSRSKKAEEDLPGYPEYSKEEDIYANAEEEELDPDTVYSQKKPLAFSKTIQDESDDLDIPGTELDDVQEEIGSEDEENNFYSLSNNDDLEDLI